MLIIHVKLSCQHRNWVYYIRKHLDERIYQYWILRIPIVAAVIAFVDIDCLWVFLLEGGVQEMSVTDTYPEQKNHMFPGASQAHGDPHMGLSNVRSYSCISPCSRTRLGHIGPPHTVSVPLLVARSLITAQWMSRLWAPRLSRLTAGRPENCSARSQ